MSGAWMKMLPPEKVAELRALRAVHQVAIYKLAAQISVHPSRLGLMLAGRIPLPEDVAEKVRVVLQGKASAA